MGNIEDINKELIKVAKITHELREYTDSHPDSLAHEFIYAKPPPRRRTINPDDYYPLLDC